MISSAITSIGLVPGQNITPDLFTEAQIREAQALAVAHLTDWFPSQDFQRGSTLYSILVRPMAMWYLVGRFEWETLRATQSLGALAQRPDLMVDEVVDAILSNFRVSRRPGSPARGRVRIDFSKNTVQSIPESLTFSSVDGIQFNPSGVFRVTDDPQDDGDVQLFGDGGGAFYCLVPVMAVEVGVGGLIRGGTPLSVSPGIPFFVTASAFGDFHEGVDQEANEALIARLPSAMAVKNLASSLSIKSVIIDQFPDVADVSVQGAFDPAMKRNSHNILGIKSGGFADIYFKPATGLSKGVVSLAATLQEVVVVSSQSRGVYSVTLQRSVFPGHYFVSAVRAAGDASGSYHIREESRAIDLTSGSDSVLSGNNMIPEVNEGVYSKYQTNTVFFEVEHDPDLGTSPTDQFLDELPVEVEVVYVPFVSEIQDFVLGRNVGVILADYLVKAAIPCLVRLPVITIDATSEEVLDPVRNSILSFISSLKIGETLRCDDLVANIRSVAGVTNVRLPIRLLADVFSPDGGVIEISSRGDLQIPQLPSSLVVPGNSAFFIEPSDINISIIVNP